MKALAERGIKSDILSLEHKGIPKALEKLGLSFEELGVKGCTLFLPSPEYRHAAWPPAAQSYPGAAGQNPKSAPENSGQCPTRLPFFIFQERCKPVDKIVEGDRLAGLVFQRTEIVEGRVKSVPDSEFEVRSPLTISSIGSIPEPIPGIPTKGELFIISDENTGKMDGYEHVFCPRQRRYRARQHSRIGTARPPGDPAHHGKFPELA